MGAAGRSMVLDVHDGAVLCSVLCLAAMGGGQRRPQARGTVTGHCGVDVPAHNSSQIVKVDQ